MGIEARICSPFPFMNNFIALGQGSHPSYPLEAVWDLDTVPWKHLRFIHLFLKNGGHSRNWHQLALLTPGPRAGPKAKWDTNTVHLSARWRVSDTLAEGGEDFQAFAIVRCISFALVVHCASISRDCHSSTGSTATERLSAKALRAQYSWETAEPPSQGRTSGHLLPVAFFSRCCSCCRHGQD